VLLHSLQLHISLYFITSLLLGWERTSTSQAEFIHVPVYSSKSFGLEILKYSLPVTSSTRKFYIEIA